MRLTGRLIICELGSGSSSGARGRRSTLSSIGVSTEKLSMVSSRVGDEMRVVVVDVVVLLLLV